MNGDGASTQDDPVGVDTGSPAAPSDDLSNREPATAARERLRALRRRARRSPLTWLLDARSGERALRASVRGQVEVARQLGKLGPGWHVLHSVNVGEDDDDLGTSVVDHLVLGPPGVFALAVRNHLRDRVKVHRRVVKVNGRMTPYLQDVRVAPARASEALSVALGVPVEVRPVLVVLAGHLVVRRQPDDVPVVGRKQIARWLMEQPERQDYDTTSAILEVARRPTTWG